MKLKSFIGGVLVAAALPFQVLAENTEYSDLWWNPNESGWGVGLQRQDDIIFLTMFVYAADGSNTWFVGPSVQLQSPDTANSIWQGPLYRSTGPAFSGPFNPALAQTTQVGAVRLTFADAETATMTYTVNGVQVTDQIQRMTWREPSVAGRYYGGFTSQTPQCAGDPLRVGVYDLLGSMTVTQTGNSVSATYATGTTGANSTCTFNANTRQAGRLQFWSGTFSCNVYIGCDQRCEGSSVVRRSGTWTLKDVAVHQSGFNGVFSARDQDCQFDGFMGGTRRP